MSGFALLFSRAWPALLLAPLVWVAFLWLDHRRRRRLRATIGERTRALVPDFAPGRRTAKRGIFGLALAFAVAAVLQPAWGEGEGPPRRRPIDMVVCLDVSRSMLARDVPDDRLTLAKREIRALAERAAGERMALVVFAGGARLLSPLTRDMAAIETLLGPAGPLSVPRGGSDAGAAIETAIGALDFETGRPGVVVLVTDGDDADGRGRAAARTAREQGVVIHCVGIGSRLGAKIPVAGAAGETWLTDPTGREVVSALDPAALGEIAKTTGGEYVDARADPEALADLYGSTIRPTAERTRFAGGTGRPENRFQWPLLAAILLWILDLCLDEKRS